MDNMPKARGRVIESFRASCQSVLLMSGTGDDAFYYQAQVCEEIQPGACLVLVHARSRLMERVRLFGSLDVNCMFRDDGEFFGVLRHHADHNAWSLEQRVALILRILGPRASSLPIEQPMLPIT